MALASSAADLPSAFALGFRFVLGLVFVLAALPKLADQRAFARAVANYGIVPHRFERYVASTLPWCELLLGLALLAGALANVIAALLAGLLVVFAVAAALNLLRGRVFDCGCYGNVAPRVIGWRLVATDLVLATMGVVVAVRAPDILTFGGLGGSTRAASLSRTDGIAVLIVASTAVAAKAAASAWLTTWAVARSFDQQRSEEIA